MVREGNEKKRGYSKITLNHKIDKMAKRGIITIIKYEDLFKYGIEETDKRASYISLKQTAGIRLHVDEIFKLFEEGDIADKNLVISEIFSYEDAYVLDPLQLDVLAKNLGEDDLNLTFNILILLYRHVIEKGIRPNKEKAYLDSLKSLLEKYPISPKKKPSFRGYVFALLGVYNDKSIVEQLIMDAENMEDLSSVEEDYDKIFTARVIENHRTELFEVERNLIKQGKIESANTLRGIKNTARARLRIIPPDDSIKIPGVDI
ncbi:hypothetical protein [Methanolobus sp. WCC5]|uniref:hypothetical protein n=1 Tax=Methanolobus sp. WCC5 TaxID=3125785 RepID=UPI003247E8EE